MNQPPTVFDRAAVGAHRRRAAGLSDGHDFLLHEVAARLVDRLADVNRRFPLAADLGCHAGQLAAALAGSDKVGALVQCDLAEAMARQAGGLRLVADEERLPFAADRFDLMLSNLSLHWVNDLPGTLVQVRRALKPDGLFLAAVLGGDSLHELRDALLAAELELSGGVRPRVSPMIGLQDAAGLLQRAGFALPVADSDRLEFRYENPFALMRELRGLGETNALAARPRGIAPRRLFETAARLYHARHADADGRIPATFEVLFLTGWVPHPSQQQPLRPGSAEHRLADALDSRERSAGEKTGRG